MKRLLLIACAAIILCALPVRILAQPPAHADSPKVTMSVTQPLVVGPNILQPGDYKFQCRTFFGKTFLVVTNVVTGKEVLRVACEREMLEGRVTESDLRSLTRPDGKRLLTSVRIKGEIVSHRIVD